MNVRAYISWVVDRGWWIVLFRLPRSVFHAPKRLAWLLALLVLMGLGAVDAKAQTDYGFQFVRVRYDAGGGRGGAAWAHDYPTAEENFYEALERTTQIRTKNPNLVLALDDDRIFEHPILYLCEPGYWVMNEEEADNLRQYLSRGGFILFDDFRGRREWDHLVVQMKRIFPDREFVEIPPEHPIWSIYYDIDPVAAPSNVSGGWGRRSYGPDADRYLALFDENGRIVAFANYNQDIGDGWEWPEQNLYQASTISFQMGINFVMYALTH